MSSLTEHSYIKTNDYLLAIQIIGASVHCSIRGFPVIRVYSEKYKEDISIKDIVGKLLNTYIMQESATYHSHSGYLVEYTYTKVITISSPFKWLYRKILKKPLTETKDVIFDCSYYGLPKTNKNYTFKRMRGFDYYVIPEYTIDQLTNRLKVLPHLNNKLGKVLYQ